MALIRELRAQALHYHLDMRLPRAWGASSQASDSSPDTAEARLTLADEWRLFAKDYPLPADMEREAFIETGARMLSEAGEE